MFPEDVITVSKKGNREVRNLISKGKFVKYNYLDPSNGKQIENKYRLVLENDDGTREEYFVIPMEGNKRYLMLPTKEKEGRKIWDGKNSVDLDDLLH